MPGGCRKESFPFPVPREQEEPRTARRRSPGRDVEVALAPLIVAMGVIVLVIAACLLTGPGAGLCATVFGAVLLAVRELRRKGFEVPASTP
jgi:hypothetical protein